MKKLTTVDDLMSKRVHAEWIGKTEVMALLQGGEVKVFSAMCPHQGGPLAEGNIREGTVTCKWHGWCFKLSDGQSTSIPSLKLKAIPHKVEKGEVFIDETLL